MNFSQQVTGFHALWKTLSVATMQTGALNQIADFKIELVI
jgi:hypothetical protein